MSCAAPGPALALDATVYRRCLGNFISVPTPVGRRWEVSKDDGKLTFTWMTLPVAPKSVLQHVQCSCQKTRCSTSACSCGKASLPCTELCQCNQCENISCRLEEYDDFEESDSDYEA